MVVDEVGSKISEGGDGYFGRTKNCCEHGSLLNNKASHYDRHFTLLGIIALTEEHILRVVIVSGITQAFEGFSLKSGSAVHVTWTPLHKSNILEAHKENTKNVKKKGKEIKMKLEKVKKLL